MSVDRDKYARIGAAARLREIAQEQKAILDAFPELAATYDGDNPSETQTAEPAKKPRRRLSSGARKRISDAQKKRWAAYRRQSASR